MGGVLGRLFKVKKLELVLVGIENSCALSERLCPHTRVSRSLARLPRVRAARVRNNRVTGPLPRSLHRAP